MSTKSVQWNNGSLKVYRVSTDHSYLEYCVEATSLTEAIGIWQDYLVDQDPGYEGFGPSSVELVFSGPVLRKGEAK